MSYTYRLYTIDQDGALSCQNNNIRTIEFVYNESLMLSQNNPNPFSTETTIKVNVPETQAITLEVLDIFGRIVATLAHNEIVRGSKDYT